MKVRINEYITSVVVALVLFFSFVNIVNSLNLRLNITMLRVTYIKYLVIEIPFFRELLIAFSFALLLLFFNKKSYDFLFSFILFLVLCTDYVYKAYIFMPLMSIMLVLWWFISSLKFIGLSKIIEILNNVVKVLSVIFISINVYSSIRYLLFFGLVDKAFKGFSWYIARIHLELLCAIQYLVVLIFTILPLIPILKEFMSIKKYKNVKQLSLSECLSDRAIYIILAIAFLMPILENTLPFLPNVNPGHLGLGVDIIYYKKWLSNVLSKGVWQIFIQADGTRPLYLLLLYALYKTLHIPMNILLQMMPSLLLLLMVFSNFFMVYKITNNKSCASIASLLLATSPQATIGIYSSFQANMLAIALLYFAYGLILSKFSYIKLIVASIIFFASELTHPSTIHFYIALLLMMLLKRNVHIKKRIFIIILPLIGILAADLLKYTLSGGLVKGTSTGVSNSLLHSFLTFSTYVVTHYWRVAYNVVALYYGGFFTYPLFLLLPLLLLYKSEYDYFINAWFVTLFPIYASMWAIYSRLMYNVPFQLPLALLIMHFHKRKYLFYLFITTSISYAMLCTINLVYPQPWFA